ncbi:MAG TPA: hypothetical protein VK879_13915 [Candidatus Sulfomarinibacteraceae bacterium]|nr:hypothetical protein [Candidatus Sulfomarinibacteraceae bacterium]
MDDALMPFLWLALTLPILLLLQRWIHRHLRGVAYLITGRMNWSVLIYAIVLFPGVLLHELSHLITARLLGVRTGSISLLPQAQKDGTIRLGYVEYYKGRTLDPIRESLIGGAPLITGTLAVLLIGLRVFDVGNLRAVIQSGDVEQLTTALSQIFTTPDFLVWLYLIFAISNAMMPSPSDRRAWPAFLLLLALSAGVLYGLDLSQLVLDGLRDPLTTLFGYLGLAFSLAIGVDIVFIFVLYVTEGIVSRIKGVELVYEAAESGQSQ